MSQALKNTLKILKRIQNALTFYGVTFSVLNVDHLLVYNFTGVHLHRKIRFEAIRLHHSSSPISDSVKLFEMYVALKPSIKD